MKKITLSIIALFSAVLVNAQSDCSTAQAITVAADASTTVNASMISGTAPTLTLCSGYYDSSDITSANWYSYTNNSGQDLFVTVNSPVPSTSSDYYASFSVLSGTCTTLTCEGGSLITQDSAGNLNDAEVSFAATAGQTYYIVFDNYYEGAISTFNSAFDFSITTDSNLPTAPGAATNPTPADGATNVTMGKSTTGENTMDFAWDAPTTGDPVDNYFIYITTDNTFQDDTAAISGNVTSNAVTDVFISGSNYFVAGTTYYWYVVPENAGGTTDSSAITAWSFTTAGTLSTKDFETVSLSHYTSNGSLNIESNFSLESINIYSISGAQVANETLNGTNAAINISNLQSGVYLAQVKAEGTVKTFKFVKK
ncbi:Por secretion system C-terminal sorting domain-containing protein [Mesonia phycicola]|uniref:Por secretion system C-terminal sorting domain-containing protein n=1 Tax=Mesonia phycicola TaxID=579105 RepID=A0A1M6GR94_9FLAO|nr:T9SS type A sorting domain-containing protein [Mesonia phycicola]SHJ12418.1 Por secretion system C-terminal sorting domain-containing protein [Mesonia phycicola]